MTMDSSVVSAPRHYPASAPLQSTKPAYTGSAHAHLPLHSGVVARSVAWNSGVRHAFRTTCASRSAACRCTTRRQTLYLTDAPSTKPAHAVKLAVLTEGPQPWWATFHPRWKPGWLWVFSPPFSNAKTLLATVAAQLEFDER